LLGGIASRIALTIAFLLVVIPVGLLQRLFGKPALEFRFKSGEITSWRRRPAEPVDYERQF
jgi:hypothetical protein